MNRPASPSMMGPTATPSAASTFYQRSRNIGRIKIWHDQQISASFKREPETPVPARSPAKPYQPSSPHLQIRSLLFDAFQSSRHLVKRSQAVHRSWYGRAKQPLGTIPILRSASAARSVISDICSASGSNVTLVSAMNTVPLRGDQHVHACGCLHPLRLPSTSVPI